MTRHLKLELASPPDRSRLVAQIIQGSEQLAEINQESKQLVVELYPRQDGEPWICSLDDLLRVMRDAKERLNGHEW